MEKRAEIRKLHKKLRDRMMAPEVEEKSRMICECLSQTDWYEKAQIIYGYYPLGNEVDCRPFLAQAIRDGKTAALPATGRRFPEDASACRMEFFQINSLADAAEGNFHVMEPRTECRIIQTQDAVVLVPGVVFDREGNRYGYGGGYYDRYFSRFPKLYRVAVCYENQMEEELVTLPTDIKMCEIFTEERVYRIV